MGSFVNYFASGRRPFHLQFPACVARLALPRSEADHLLGTAIADFEIKKGLELTSRSESEASSLEEPWSLHSVFDPSEVRPWRPEQFEMVRTVQESVRTKNQVHVMRDVATGVLVLAKQIPNERVGTCHAEFVQKYPTDLKQPWQDIGCNKFLSEAGYPYACRLLGVYRDEEYTMVVTELASAGDLFTWSSEAAGPHPGPERESLLKPLVRQILSGVQRLHDMSVVHRDLSLENLVISPNEADDGAMQVCVVNFSMASTARWFKSTVSGKTSSFQAPESHSDSDEYDAFLSDVFAIGVSLWAAFLQDYPWLSTKPGGCRCFEFFRKHGFRKYIAKRKVRGSNVTVASVMSEELQCLLEGLLAVDPVKRLTLGEASWDEDGVQRRSVWDEPWLQHGQADSLAEKSAFD